MSATAKLMAMLGMDASAFNKGVDQAERRTKGFGSALEGMKGKIAAAFTLAAVAGAVKGIADKASDIADAAENLSITTDEFQAMAIAAKQFGIEAEDITSLLNRMTLAQSDFVSGSPSKELVERMAALGVSLDQADAMNAAQFFEAVSKGAQQSADGLDAALKMMGKTGPRFQAFMRLMSGVGLGGMISEAKASGEMISKKDIASTDAVVDGLIQGWKNKITKAAASVVGAVAGAASGGAVVADEAQSKRAERNRAARKRADEEAAAKLTEDAAEIRAKNAFDALSDEQKLVALKEQELELTQKMAQATTLSARAALDKQLAEVEGKIQGMKGGKQGPGMSYDQLRRVGAGVFSGTANDAVPKKQLAVQTKMMGFLETLARGDKREMGRF
jgi:hypothetical protein